MITALIYDMGNFFPLCHSNIIAYFFLRLSLHPMTTAKGGGFLRFTKILCGYLEIDKTGFPSFKHIIALIIISIIFSHFLVLWDKFRARIDWKFIFKAPVLPSVWAETIKKAASNEEWAFVFLKDGWIYRGWISQYTYDPDAAFQDFILSNAALFDSEFNHIYDISNAGCVYIDTRNVSRIEFEKGNIMSKNQKNPEEKV